MSRWSARMDFGTAYPQTAVAVGVDNQPMPYADKITESRRR
jgi:hypothetical protein